MATEPSTREATKYGSLIGKIDNDFYFLDEAFKYSDNFKGVTGTILRAVSKEEYDDRTSDESKEDYAREFWQMAVAKGDTDDGLSDWMDYNDLGDDFVFDLSGTEYWPQLRALGYSEEEYPVFECTGFGRCFTKDMPFDTVYASQPIVGIINEFEDQP